MAQKNIDTQPFHKSELDEMEKELLEIYRSLPAGVKKQAFAVVEEAAIEQQASQ